MYEKVQVPYGHPPCSYGWLGGPKGPQDPMGPMKGAFDLLFPIVLLEVLFGYDLDI